MDEHFLSTARMVIDSTGIVSSLQERTVLSAPQKPWETKVQSTAILVVSLLSILGAGWIVLSFCLFKQVRTFRHQLILGLAISDFWMAVNFLSSCAMNISGRYLSAPEQKGFCSFNGFMTQFFVVQTDYWVLLIAVCTFLILGNYKHVSSWIQEHRIVLWSVPWGLSALWAALGLGLAGYGDIGAWCWFTSDKVRLLVNFIPRWIIILIILALYARLYRLIYKAHNRFMSFNDDTTPRTFEHNDADVESVTELHHQHRPTNPSPLSQTKSLNINTSSSNHINSGNTAAATGAIGGPGLTHTRRPSPLLKKTAYQMMSYPLVYMLIWTIPTTIRIYQSVTGKAAPFGIATTDKACIVVQGFADAIIYGVSETSLGVWRERFGSGADKGVGIIEGRSVSVGDRDVEMGERESNGKTRKMEDVGIVVDVRHEVTVERVVSVGLSGRERTRKEVWKDGIV
ncbi:hypothetical protein BU24DRAFT_488753 [Aaosphaeria arxii CBS 175.79]|uniref:G-protein coupled receptors family 2 profile 2 domain-containing protein n=1 Tax=Aaosphaeria arxii CBS 175.79 TaxID=1450172 RepID=A0A6A5Y0R2_9PLEO|nr:uncharacterized protein BU24DRAFT_488753 [Aaosphaeria arxii CBS 175.79]KAF2018667.1 hypothetical protein BU24DRAFT_488753 [Aaosphaeria arxii CBS 175.79]